MGGRKYSAKEREKLLKGLANRQQSLAGYAKAHGVSVATLYNWQQQASRPDLDFGDNFVEIDQPGDLFERVPFTLSMGSVTLRFEQLPDIGWLAALVEKLSR